MPTWIGDNGTWTNAANWSGGVPNGIGVLADIPVSSNGGTLTIGIPENMDIIVGRMFITGTGTSGVLIRGSAADSGTGVGTLVFNNNNGNNATAILNVDTLAGSGPTVFSSASGLNMRLDDELFVDTVNSGTITRFDLDVSGSGQLIKTGNGILELNGNNSFSGGVLIYDGLLDVENDAALGSAGVLIAFNAMFRSAGTIDNNFRTGNLSTGNDGSGQIVAATGTTMTGALNHVSQGTMSFGDTNNAGTIAAGFSAITHNATESHFALYGGTLRMGSSYAAANLLSNPVSTTFIEGENGGNATLDTGGFATTISNLTLKKGLIRASSGTLDLTIIGSFNIAGVGGGVQGGTFEGTNGIDRLVINATDDAFLASGGGSATFTNWTDGVDIIQINGNGANNVMGGSRQSDIINGNDGNDIIFGNGGVDTIDAGNGDDHVYINGSNFFANTGSFVHGGAGSDILSISSGTVTLGSISGFEAVELLFSTNVLQLTGTQFSTGLASNAVLSGNGRIIVDLDAGAGPLLFKLMTEEAGSDVQFTINGTSGADIIKANDFTINTLNGGAGTDLLNGGNSGDFINGGNDADKIRGGGGVDVMTGGAGADVFKYRNFSDAGTGIFADIINDFVSGTDKLNFRRLDADPGTAGTQAFAFIGTNAFAANGTAQIRYVDTGNDLRVDVDANGDGNADMSIALLGAGAGAGLLFASDFVL